MGLTFEIHNQRTKSGHVICSKKAAESMVHREENVGKKPISKKLCICSDTTHAGSFKCRLHRSNIPDKDQTRCRVDVSKL